MTLYRDDAVVLRVQKLGEADRIITLLTRRNGRVRAVAKGVRRTKSKFGGRLEPFSHVDAQLYVGTAERLTAEEREPALRLYLLLVGGLRALTEETHDARLVLDAFALRALAVSGYSPALGECARCGVPGPHRWFSVQGGGTVCADCRPSGSATPSPEALLLLEALLDGDWPAADASESRHQREASGLTAAYLQWHLEHSIRSLRLVEHA